MENGFPIHFFQSLSIYTDSSYNFSVFDGDFTIVLQQDSMFLRVCLVVIL